SRLLSVTAGAAAAQLTAALSFVPPQRIPLGVGRHADALMPVTATGHGHQPCLSLPVGYPGQPTWTTSRGRASPRGRNWVRAPPAAASTRIISSLTSRSTSDIGRSKASQIAASSSEDASLRPRSTSDRYPRLTRAAAEISRRVRPCSIRRRRKTSPTSRLMSTTGHPSRDQSRLCLTPPYRAYGVCAV